MEGRVCLSLFISLLNKWRNVSPMGNIRGSIDSDTEDEFRKIAMKKFGYCKGSLSHALEEAVSQWIKSNKKISGAKE